jgi:hypothetical protein
LAFWDGNAEMARTKTSLVQDEGIKFADGFAAHMLPLIHFAVLRRLDPAVIFDLTEIWVDFNADWYRHADLPEPKIAERLRQVMADYCVTGFGYSPDEFPLVELVLVQTLAAVLQARAAYEAALAGKNAAAPYQFVVFAAEEGLEIVPKIKVVSKQVANHAFAETAGRPQDGHTYGHSKWNYTHVRFVAGCYASVAEALGSGFEAAVRLQCEVDQARQQQLDEAQSGRERKQINRYHKSFRQVHLECERQPGGRSLDSPYSIRTMQKHRSRFDQYARRVERFFHPDGSDR